MEAQAKPKRRRKGYVIQPRYLGPRAGDDKAGERMRKLFVPVTKEEYDALESTCGNLHSHFHYDTKLKRVVSHEKWYTSVELEKRNGVPLYQAISSALALYRGICLFPNPNLFCEGSEGYKYPWALPLKHVATGEMLILGEWKGAFGFHTRLHGLKGVSVSFKRDTCKLLTLMLSNKCPHPYDQVVAGSVA